MTKSMKADGHDLVEFEAAQEHCKSWYGFSYYGNPQGPKAERIFVEIEELSEEEWDRLQAMWRGGIQRVREYAEGKFEPANPYGFRLPIFLTDFAVTHGVEPFLNKIAPELRRLSKIAKKEAARQAKLDLKHSNMRDAARDAELIRLREVEKLSFGGVGMRMKPRMSYSAAQKAYHRAKDRLNRLRHV